MNPTPAGTGRDRTRRTRRRLAAVAATVVAAALSTAMPAAGIDGTPGDEDLPTPYVAPADGFTWAMAPRYATDTWNERDGHQAHDGRPETYDPAYVHPDHWDVDLAGCVDEVDHDRAADEQPTVHTYTWTIDGEVTSGPDCTVRHRFESQGAHDVALTVTDADGEVVGEFAQEVDVRDLLIVSLGDSYGSGEGNPDVAQTFDAVGLPAAGADWLDDRCHRTPNAGPYQAARDLERLDPHTSVTFISFACSGATLIREYGDMDPLDPFQPFDPATSHGSGITGPYDGVEPGPNFPTLPSQVDQMVDAVRDRPIDALIVSGGGNDAAFAPIAAVCVLYPDCPEHRVGSAQTPLAQRFQQDLGQIALGYQELSRQLDDAATRGLQVGGVYLTEYPDPTSANAAGDPCGQILDDVISPVSLAVLAGTAFGPLGVEAFALTGGFKMDGAEVQFARDTILPGINGTVREAALRHGWRYVDGVAAGYAGHGYCSSEPWLRRAPDSTRLQGPSVGPALAGVNSATTGTLHPTTQGHAVYARRLVANLKPLLTPPAALPAAPTVTVDESKLGRDDEGWVTGGNLLFAQAASAPPAGGSAENNGLASVELTVDGTPWCVDHPADCATSGPIDNQRYGWRLALPTGIHTVTFTATDWYGTTTTETRELRVDRTLPPAPTVSVVEGDRGGSLWYRGETAVRIDAEGTHDGRTTAVRAVVDGEVRTVEPGEVIRFAEPGHHEVVSWVETGAGRTSARKRVDFYIGRPDLVAMALPSGIYRSTTEGTDLTRVIPTDLGRGDPTFSPDGNRIAYWDLGRIHVVDADGSNDRLLGEDGRLGATPSHLAWSPDGTWLTVYDRNNLSVIGVDSGDGLRLASYTGEPTWTDDGRVVVDLLDDARPGLWAFDVETGDAELFSDLEGTVGMPALSADGTQLAYLTDDGSGEGTALAVVDPTDPESTRILAGSLDGASGATYSSPTWSPGDERIVYAREQDERTQIWTIRPDGTDARRIRSFAVAADVDPDASPNLDPVENGAPAARDDLYATDEDVELTVDAPGVLGNDVDPDGDELAARLLERPASGTVELDGSGGLRFRPAADANGEVTFAYEVGDGVNEPVRATVTIDVAPVNDAPVAVDDSATTPAGETVNVRVVDNDTDVDGDALGGTVVDQPGHGTASIYGGVATYVPQAGWTGTDTFTYVADDGELTSEPATVTIEVTGSPPVCTIRGTDGNDVLFGTPGRDVICGLGGNDTILGLGGDDVLLGGAGNDVLLGGNGTDVVDGGPGWDVAIGTRRTADQVRNCELRL